MDFDAIFAAAEVAQRESITSWSRTAASGPPLESVKISYHNLQRRGIAP